MRWVHKESWKSQIIEGLWGSKSGKKGSRDREIEDLAREFWPNGRPWKGLLEMGRLQRELDTIAQQLKNGVTPETVTVRKILDWMGVSRRGTWVNMEIRSALERAGLRTEPHFAGAYVHEPITIVPIGSNESKESISAIYRIGGLEAANKKPISVSPDSSLCEATTAMLAHKYSQLPVMTTEREVKGIISWKSIGSRLSLGKMCSQVRECMDPAQTISAERYLFDAIAIISEHDYVLVRAKDQTICGIVTASDLSRQFRDLAEPFLLIGECENLLRRLIHGKFKVEELEAAKNVGDSARTVTGVADLTLGEYVRLLEEPRR